MINTFHIPSPPLNHYIECLWHSEGSAPALREKLLPMPGMAIMVNFGAPSRMTEVGGTQRFTDCKETWLSGLRSHYVLLESPPEMHVMSIAFKPGGAYSFLRFPLSEIHNRTVSLDAIWGRFADEIRERLYAAPDIPARFGLLESLLLTRLCERPRGLDAVQHAVDEIARCRGNLSIQALSDRIGMSQQHVIAQFKRMVGMTPKALARLHRFQYVLESIDPMNPVDWTMIVHQAHFYDQSHFNKDFEAFTGHSPGEYLRLRRQMYSENSEHAQYLTHLQTL